MGSVPKSNNRGGSLDKQNSADNLFDFSEIIQNDHQVAKLVQLENSIEFVGGTGGSGTSEITQNLYNIMQSQNSDVINIIQNQERRSVEVQQPNRANEDWNEHGGRDSQYGYSSSHMSY